MPRLEGVYFLGRIWWYVPSACARSIALTESKEVVQIYYKDGYGRIKTRGNSVEYGPSGFNLSRALRRDFSGLWNQDRVAFPEWNIKQKVAIVLMVYFVLSA